MSLGTDGASRSQGMQADDDFGDATNREANMRFAEVVNGFVGKGDMVWVQDYHRASHQSQKA